MTIMDEHEEEGLEEPTQDLGPLQGPPPNLAEALRARRKEISDNTETLMDLPGYENVEIPGIGTISMVARYRRLDYQEQERIANKVAQSKAPRRTLHGQLDTIALACVEILLRMPDGNVKPLGHIIPGHDPEDPITYDKRLAEFLGLQNVDGARSVVLGVLANESAVTPHYIELNTWMMSSNVEDEEGF